MPLELIGGCILNCRHAATHSCAPRSSTRAISQPLGREGAKKRHPEASGAHFGERGRRNYSEPAGWPNLITSRLPLACFAAETGGLIGLERRRFCANNRRRARLSAALLISRHVLSPPLARVRAPSGQTLRPTGDLRASARSNYLAAREQALCLAEIHHCSRRRRRLETPILASGEPKLARRPTDARRPVGWARR